MDYLQVLFPFVLPYIGSSSQITLLIREPGTSACLSLCGDGLVSKSCLTLCDLMDCSPPNSSVLGIFWASILEWVAISSSRRSS